MTIRFHLTIWFIVVILLANSLISFVASWHVGNALIQEVQTRVSLDLNSARRVYEERLSDIERFLRTLDLHDELLANDRDAVQRKMNALFKAFQQEMSLDMMILTDAAGSVFYRANQPNLFGDDFSSNRIARKSIESERAVSGTIIVPQAELLKESETLAHRAFFNIDDIPKSKPAQKPFIEDGMAIAVAIPIFSKHEPNQFLGVLYGASLLNRRYEIVDTIIHEVFQNQTFDGKTIGNATIFQGDVRISTNVRREDGTRAIGTRLSEPVYEKVLNDGEVWADTAFVVNDWYITAYEPIRNPDGQIIGALYVGLLEQPFKRFRYWVIFPFVGMVIIITFASLLLIDWITKTILKPIGKIVSMTQEVADGNLKARVEIRPAGEMGELCAHIDAMAQAVDMREEELKHTTRRQIGQSEKLAAIGRLAAGIAHEINNPLTGVLTFAHLLKQKDNMEPQDKADLDVIANETTRVREIVRGLLDFARESPSEMNELDINQILRQTVRLVRSQKEHRLIDFHEQYEPDLPCITGDKNQLQQVFLNLILNACEAMRESGMLRIETFAPEPDRVSAQISDTGCGIAQEHLEKIFDPFFTTKPVGKGTGLGLSVTYGIVQNHNGTIQVKSEINQGAAFIVSFPSSIELSMNHSKGPDVK